MKNKLINLPILLIVMSVGTSCGNKKSANQTAVTKSLAQEVSKKQFIFGVTDIASYPVLRNGSIYEMESSYDRSGGNDDGFKGTYSILCNENGNSVISETEGAGMITRIWFPYDASFPDAPMFLRDKKIFIFLDGNPVPVIDMPLIEMFNNTNKNFPYPLCGMALGGCWCNTPIPFNHGAKIVVEGDKVAFFHIQYTKYPKNAVLESFRPENSPVVAEREKTMNGLWNSGDTTYLNSGATETIRTKYKLHKGINNLDLQKGPAIMRAFIVKGSRDNLDKFLDGRIEFAWDNAKRAAIEAPLSMFFIQEKCGLNGKSLLAGILPEGDGVYNFFPMPYRKNAVAKFIMPEKCEVEITTLFGKYPDDDSELCYLHTNYVKEYPTVPGKMHEWLKVQGEGHYVGVYMRVEGKSLSDSSKGTIYWTGCLEGDEVFEVDGKMIQHGTGTEDYFNAGWNGMAGRLDHAQNFPFHGYTLYNAGKDVSSAAAYRWHLPTEVVPFKKQMKASIEVGPGNGDQGNYGSLAYYYLRIQK